VAVDLPRGARPTAQWSASSAIEVALSSPPFPDHTQPMGVALLSLLPFQPLGEVTVRRVSSEIREAR
jgi:hypothetical protein